MLDHEKLDVYLVDPSLYQEGKNLLVRIVAMITKMCLRSE
jgi:hypothetical protein